MCSLFRAGQICSKGIGFRKNSNAARFTVKTVKEHPDPVEGKIKGSIPSWISGRLLRVGPGIFEFGDTKYNHWFDGQSLLHSFTINNGKVQYRSRYLRSESFKKNTAANRIVVTEFGTLGYPDPCKTLFQRIMATFQNLSPNNGTDNCNVNLYPVGEDIVVTTETNAIYRIDPGTLDTMERINLSNYIAINGASAHPHLDPDGTVYNLGTAYRGRPHTCVVKIPTNWEGNYQDIGRGKVICSIPSKRGIYPSYHHSFGMSENYIIITEQPAYLNVPGILGSSVFGKGGGKMQVVMTNKDEKVYFRVVQKSNGEEHAIQYEADCFFTFHHINTFEDNGNIVVDLCCTTDEKFYNFGFIDDNIFSYFPDENKHSVRRYVLPLNTATKPPGENLVTLNYTNATAALQADGCIKCTHEVLSPIAFEFPRINYSVCNGKQYRFVYGVAGVDKLLKLDVMKKTVKLWMENASLPSEPVFVPHPSAKNEDDGVILSAVIHSDPDQNPYLLILDSNTMNEIGRAEFEEVKFHKDLHGIFHNC